MYVANPVEPKAPYGYPDLPPYPGLLHAPAEPGPDGHFDNLDARHRRLPRRPCLRVRAPRPRHLRGLCRPGDPLVLPADGRAAGDRAAHPRLGQCPVGVRLPRARRERPGRRPFLLRAELRRHRPRGRAPRPPRRDRAAAGKLPQAPTSSPTTRRSPTSSRCSGSCTSTRRSTTSCGGPGATCSSTTSSTASRRRATRSRSARSATRCASAT